MHRDSESVAHKDKDPLVRGSSLNWIHATSKRVSEAYRRAFTGLPREIWFLAIVMLINRSGTMVLPFLSLYVHQELGFDPTWSGMMIVAYGLGSCLGTFLGGIATERWGAIRVQIGSLFGNAIGFILLAQMTSYVAFALTLFLVSIVSDAFRPANSVSVTELSTPESHRQAFTLNRLAINLGFTIGPALGGVLATISYPLLFWIDGITCGFAGMAMWYLLGGKNLVQHASRSSDLARGSSPWRDRPYLLFLGFTLLTYSVFFQLMATYPLFLKEEYGLNEWKIGLLFGLNTIIVVLFEMLLVDTLRGLSPIKIIAWGSFFMCEGFAMLSFGQGLAFAVLSALIYTLGEMLAMPQGFAFVASFGEESSRSRYMGAYSTIIAMAFVVGPLLGAWCYGIHHYLFWTLCLPAGVIVLLGMQSPLAQPRRPRVG